MALKAERVRESGTMARRVLALCSSARVHFDERVCEDEAGGRIGKKTWLGEEILCELDAS